MDINAPRRAFLASCVSAPFVVREALASHRRGGTWPTATPAGVGLDRGGLLAAQAYATRWGGAGCVVRHGRIAHSWGSFSSPFPVHSVAKSWGSLALGLAVDDGRVRLADRVRDHLPEFGRNPSSNVATGWLDSITFEHLATHTAGFGRTPGYTPLEARPGSRFGYSDSGCNWLGAALTNVYRRDLREVTAERLFAPMGIATGAIRWRTPSPYFTRPVGGVRSTEISGGMWATVDAMARLGQLMLDRGRWNGRQLVSADYVARSTSAYADRVPGVPTLRGYGLLWWNNAAGAMRAIPRDCFWALGKYDNVSVVIPSLRLVVVRVGPKGWRDHGGSLEAFLTPIVRAVVG